MVEGEGVQILVVIHEMSRVPEMHAAALIGVIVGIGPVIILSHRGAIEVGGFSLPMNQAILSRSLQRYVNTLNLLSLAPIILVVQDMVVVFMNVTEAVVVQEPCWDSFSFHVTAMESSFAIAIVLEHPVFLKNQTLPLI